MNVKVLLLLIVSAPKKNDAVISRKKKVYKSYLSAKNRTTNLPVPTATKGFYKKKLSYISNEKRPK
jgi:hypothetical protein